MNCKPDPFSRRNRADTRKAWKAQKRRQRAVMILVMAVLTLYFTVMRMGNEPQPASRTWKQMPGNDGKMWEGNPDISGYSGIEGVECREYEHHSYDKEGRRIRTEIFRKHEYYPNVWCLNDAITYEYDSQGRVTSRAGESDRWDYTYDESGYTETYQFAYAGDRRDVYVYDSRDLLIFSRLTHRYAAGFEHELRIDYDEQGRRIRETSRIGQDPAYVSRTVVYDDEARTGLAQTYNAQGEAECIVLSRYDEEGRELDNVWCDLSALPEGVSEELWENYSTVGYRAYYQDGRLAEELTDQSGGCPGGTGVWYEAYDYDRDGNRLLDLTVFGQGSIYLERYVYDGQGNLTDRYYYNCCKVQDWEIVMSNGDRIVINNDGAAEPFAVTRERADKSLLHRFVYEDGKVPR